MLGDAVRKFTIGEAPLDLSKDLCGVVSAAPSRFCPAAGMRDKDSNLVDSASSHTLVSKIKPCMSKYKSFTLKLRTAHYISYSLFDSPLLLG